MFLKELVESPNDDLTKDGYMSHLDKEQAKITRQRMKKDESKPSASAMLRNWVERNNATADGAQILYALVKHLESSDPGMPEKIIEFIKGSEGMDEGLKIELNPDAKAALYRKHMHNIPSAEKQRDDRIMKKEKDTRTRAQAAQFDKDMWKQQAGKDLQKLVRQES